MTSTASTVIALTWDRIGVDRVEAPGHGRTRCAQVAITYVCVAVDGRGKVPIPADLREALVRHHS